MLDVLVREAGVALDMLLVNGPRQVLLSSFATKNARPCETDILVVPAHVSGQSIWCLKSWASAAPKFPGGFGWLWFNLSEIPCEWGSNSSFDDPSSPHLFYLFG